MFDKIKKHFFRAACILFYLFYCICFSVSASLLIGLRSLSLSLPPPRSWRLIRGRPQSEQSRAEKLGGLKLCLQFSICEISPYDCQLVDESGRQSDSVERQVFLIVHYTLWRFWGAFGSCALLLLGVRLLSTAAVTASIWKLNRQSCAAVHHRLPHPHLCSLSANAVEDGPTHPFLW